MDQYGSLLSAIIRIVSSSAKVDLDMYTAVTKKLYLLLVEKLAWVSITPTLHKLLAHSGELMDLNRGCGLKAWSEEGMEANNKTLRYIRERLSRKQSQEYNLRDCFKRLWLGSDPQVTEVRNKGKPFCHQCKTPGHTKRSCHVMQETSEMLENLLSNC